MFPQQALRVVRARIKMIEPELSAATTIPFENINTSEEGRSQLLSIMKQYGFAVVTGVVDTAGVQQLEADWCTDLTNITNMSKVRQLMSKPKAEAFARNPVANWPHELPLGMGVASHSFAGNYGLPHGHMAWNARKHPNVKKCFEALFQGETNLCCSVDNPFFAPLSTLSGTDESEERLWPHTDKNCDKPGSGACEIYQGVLYIWASDSTTSATVIWPRSHTRWREIRKLCDEASHFCPVMEEEYGSFVDGARRVAVPAGGMVLWNSQTVHQGYNLGPRLALPICFEPRSRRSNEALERKRQCCLLGIPTSHWASLGIPHPYYTELVKSAPSPFETPPDLSRAGGGGGGPLSHCAQKHLFTLSAMGQPTLDPSVEMLL